MSDYISRDSIRHKLWNKSYRDPNDATEVCVIINIEPSADVRENIHGEWIKVDLKAYTEYLWECNRCKAHHRAMYDFCPSCGADMRGNDDEQT